MSVLAETDPVEIPGMGGEPSLAGSSLLLLAFTQIGNLANLGFQVFMGWSLPPRDFTLFMAMNSVFLLVMQPADALRSAFSHTTTLGLRASRPGALRGMARVWWGRLSLTGVAVILVSTLARRPLLGWIGHDDPRLLLATAVAVGGVLWQPLYVGMLQGRQAFGWMMAAQQGMAVARLVVGVALVRLVTGPVAASPMLAAAAAALLAVAVGRLGCRVRLPEVFRAPAAPPPATFGYALLAMTVIAGFSALMVADNILVGALFPGDDGDRYARAALIARTVVFLPMPIAIALFPKVTSEGRIDRAHGRMLAQTLAATAGMVLVINLAGTIWPELSLRLLFNLRDPDLMQRRLLQTLVWTLSPLAPAFLLMNFEIAQRRFRAAMVLPVCGACYVLCLRFLSPTVWHVALWMGVWSALALALLTAGLPWKALRGR